MLNSLVPRLMSRYLYFSIVRPHLKYAVKAWNSHLEGDIEKLEIVQRKTTRIPIGFDKLQYAYSLKRFSYTTLKNRRLTGDLIEMYKVMRSRQSINWGKPLNPRKNMEISRPAASLRGNFLNIRRQSFSLRIRNNFCSWATIRDSFFVNMVVQTRNTLPNYIFTSPSLNSFKSAIYVQFKRFGCYSFQRKISFIKHAAILLS